MVGKLNNAGCKILGVVLNKVDHRKSGKYYGKIAASTAVKSTAGTIEAKNTVA